MNEIQAFILVVAVYFLVMKIILPAIFPKRCGPAGCGEEDKAH